MGRPIPCRQYQVVATAVVDSNPLTIFGGEFHSASTAGRIILRNGSAGGAIKLEDWSYPATTTGYSNHWTIPANGIPFPNGLHATIVGGSSRAYINFLLNSDPWSW